MPRKSLAMAFFFLVAGLNSLGIHFPYQQPIQGLLGILAGIFLILER